MIRNLSLFAYTTTTTNRRWISTQVNSRRNLLLLNNNNVIRASNNNNVIRKNNGNTTIIIRHRYNFLRRCMSTAASATAADKSASATLASQTAAAVETASTTAAATTRTTTTKGNKTIAGMPNWIVEHPNTVMGLPILGNAAYFSLASGFLCSDLLSLRLLLVCGYSGLVTYHALKPKPMLIPLRWSAFFVLVNASMATILLLDSLPPTLSEEEETLHVHNFAPLSLKQFRSLIDIGTRTTFKEGEFLTKAGTQSNKLFFILNGNASMKDSTGEYITTLQRGAFPNCTSFQKTGWCKRRRQESTSSSSSKSAAVSSFITACSGGSVVHNNDDDNNSNSSNNAPSYATIECINGPVECIVWDGDELLSLLEEDDDTRLRMDHCVIESMITRLLVHKKGERVKDYIRVIAQGWAHEAVQQRKIHSMATTLLEEEKETTQRKLTRKLSKLLLASNK